MSGSQSSAHDGLQLERQGYNRPRRSVDRGGTHAELEQNGGQLLQINTFSQFHKLFYGSIRQFQTPQAICGYVSMASAVACNAVLSKLPGRRISSVKQLHQLEAALRDAPSLLPGVQASMNYVFQSRKRYIECHSADFRTERSRREYLSAWVANFEISDFFRDQRRRGVDLKGVMFLRFNQASELGAATHEERKRIIEEEVKFGSAKRSACDKATDFAPGDIVFLAETFFPKWSLNTPEHYAATANATASNIAPTSVFVLDLNGHFCIAVPAQIDGKRLLVLFNTTSANYLTGAGGLVSAMAYDLSFCTSTSDLGSSGDRAVGINSATSGLINVGGDDVVCIDTDDLKDDNAVIDLTTSSTP
eukprot:INCI14829.1.p1 GENE.INCI14829.1~~INCI14829.1.p1  ORF type:complete len:362 (-),score=65.27 INCI14829.1:78-1163(-)